MELFGGMALGFVACAAVFVVALRRANVKPEGKTAKFLNALK